MINLSNHINLWIIKIDQEIWNNKFCYSLRKNKWSNTTIYITDTKCIDVSHQNNHTIYNKLKQENIWWKSDLIAFEEIDTKDNIISCQAIKHQIVIKNETQYIFIVDNHNHTLLWWFWAYKEWIISWNTEVIHIDQHADMWHPDKKIINNIYNLTKQNQIKYIQDFVIDGCNVWSFLLPAKELWIIDNIIQIRTKIWLENIDLENKMDFILDIDCDFWSNEIDDESIYKVKKMMQKAKIITIASSPYFITFEKADKIISKLLS